MLKQVELKCKCRRQHRNTGCLSGPFLSCRCLTHVAAIFDGLFSALLSWHALELTSSIYIQENMEKRLINAIWWRKRKRERQDDRWSMRCLKAQETPLKTISIVRPHTIITNVTHCPPHAHTKTFIPPCLSADGSACELFTSGNVGTI